MTENEFEGILEAYQSLMVDIKNEIASKVLVRKAFYLAREEQEAICREQVLYYLEKLDRSKNE